MFFSHVLKTGAGLQETSHVQVSRKTRGMTFLPWRGWRRGNGLAHEYAGSEPPLRAALLSADHMAQHGKTLVGSHKLGLEHAPDRLLTWLTESVQDCTAIHAALRSPIEVSAAPSRLLCL